jgi:imidazolonepropionase-like amidohydrolase
VGTLDAEANVNFCPASLENARTFVAAGGKLLYGTDYPNPGTPNHVDGAELELLHRAGLTRIQVLAAATGEAGKELHERLGVLSTGAPADVLVVRGDPRKNLSALGRPLLVLAGGVRVS